MFKKALFANGIVSTIYLMIAYPLDAREGFEILASVVGLLIGILVFFVVFLVYKSSNFFLTEIIFRKVSSKRKYTCPKCGTKSLSFSMKTKMLMNVDVSCYKCDFSPTYSNIVTIVLYSLVLIVNISILHIKFQGCCMDRNFFATLIPYIFYLPVTLVILISLPFKSVVEE